MSLKRWFAILLHRNSMVAFAINNPQKIYNNNLNKTWYTYHLIVFNSTETPKSNYSCIFYFVGNGIAGTVES